MKSMWRYWAAECLLLLVVALADFFVRGGFANADLLHGLGVLGSSAVVASLIASLVFALGDFAWLVALPVAIWCAVLTFLEWFFRGYFQETGLVGGAFVVRFLTMSWASVWNYLSQCAFSACLAIALLAIYIWLSFRVLVGMRVQSMTIKSIVVGAVMFASLSFALPWSTLHDHVGKALCDHAFFSTTVSHELASAGFANIPEGYTLSLSNAVGVVVLGESASAKHWSLYGYSRKTTPRLEHRRQEMVVFTDVTCELCYTLFALRDILIEKSGKQTLSLPAVALSAGYSCSYCSAQGTSDGIDNNIGEMLFRQCTPRHYVPKVGKDHHRVDDALMPLVNAHLDGASSNAIVFVQMIGSHTPWETRCPATMSVYASDYVDAEVTGLSSNQRSNVNAYDNSVILTDYVLSEIIERLEREKRLSYLIYFSDHGESPRTFSRDMSSPELYSIPFFAWFSSEYRRTHANKIRQLNAIAANSLKSTQLFPIMLDIMGVVDSR